MNDPEMMTYTEMEAIIDAMPTTSLKYRLFDLLASGKLKWPKKPTTPEGK